MEKNGLSVDRIITEGLDSCGALGTHSLSIIKSKIYIKGCGTDGLRRGSVTFSSIRMYMIDKCYCMSYINAARSTRDASTATSKHRHTMQLLRYLKEGVSKARLPTPARCLQQNILEMDWVRGPQDGFGLHVIGILTKSFHHRQQ